MPEPSVVNGVRPGDDSASMRLAEDVTGNNVPSFKLMKVPFDRYVVTVRLTPKDEFIDVVEISVDKEFLSMEQKLQSVGYHDVEDLY